MSGSALGTVLLMIQDLCIVGLLSRAEPDTTNIPLAIYWVQRWTGSPVRPSYGQGCAVSIQVVGIQEMLRLEGSGRLRVLDSKSSRETRRVRVCLEVTRSRLGEVERLQVSETCN